MNAIKRLISESFGTAAMKVAQMNHLDMLVKEPVKVSTISYDELPKHIQEKVDALRGKDDDDSMKLVLVLEQ